MLEEPVTWTEGDWTYEADATLRSGVLELELTMSSRLPADQLPSPVELRLGLSADGEPLHNAVHTITPYSVADAGEGSGYPRYRLEQGYQTTASTRLRCTMPPRRRRTAPSMSAVWASRGECSPSDWCRQRRPPRYRRLGRSPRGI